MTKARETNYVLCREFFQVMLVTYLTATLAETLHTGVVSNFFNLNYLLIVVLISGVGMVIAEPQKLLSEVKHAAKAAVETVAPKQRSVDGLSRRR